MQTNKEIYMKQMRTRLTIQYMIPTIHLTALDMAPAPQTHLTDHLVPDMIPLKDRLDPDTIILMDRQAQVHVPVLALALALAPAPVLALALARDMIISKEHLGHDMMASMDHPVQDILILLMDRQGQGDLDMTILMGHLAQCMILLMGHPAIDTIHLMGHRDQDMILLMGHQDMMVSAKEWIFRGPQI